MSVYVCLGDVVVIVGVCGLWNVHTPVRVHRTFDQFSVFILFIRRPSGRLDLEFALPHSVTTWVFQALGVSSDSGLCVAPPTNLTTFTTFFLQVDLPYSAVRLEQLEVRVTVYNYLPRLLEVLHRNPPA